MITFHEAVITYLYLQHAKRDAAQEQAYQGAWKHICLESQRLQDQKAEDVGGLGCPPSEINDQVRSGIFTAIFPPRT